MRRKTSILLVLLLLVCWTGVNAQDGEDLESEPLILSGDQGEHPLGLYLELLEDPSGELSIEDITSPEYAVRFSPSQDEVPNFGFTDSAYWVRLRLRNEDPVIENYLLDLGFANMHFVDLYSPLVEGDGFEVKQTGAMRPPASRDVLHPHIVFDLTIPNQSEQTLYMRFQNGGSMTLPLTLWAEDDFMKDSLWDHFLQIALFGLLMGMLAYNLFLLVSLREVSYLYLVLLIVGLLVQEGSYSGYLEVYVIPDLYNLKQHYMALSNALWMLAMVMFADSFLAMKSVNLGFHRLLLAVAGIWVLLGLLTLTADFYNIASLMAPFMLISMVAIMLAGVIAWRRHGFRYVSMYLVAWLGLIIGISMVSLVRQGFIASTALTENLYRFGYAWLVVVWSLALADRINLLKTEAESANRELQNSEHRLTQTLEAMPVGVVVYGTDQKPTYMNKRTADILTNPNRGTGPDLSAGRTLAESMAYFSFRVAGSDETYPLENMPVHQALQGESSSVDNLEADLIDKRVPLEIWASPVFDSTGDVESVVVAFQDITERKQSEMAMHASEARFRAIVENNFEGIIFIDRDRKLVYVSPSYEQLSGRSPKELIGHSGVGFIHPDDQTYVAETFNKALQQPGGRISEEYRIKHKDGSWVWIETNVMNLLDDPHVQAVVLNSRNITERKQREAELGNYRLHLERLVLERTEELNTINEQLMVEMAERAVLEGLLHKRIAWMSILALARQRIKGSADLPLAYEQLSEELLQLLDAGSLFLMRWQEGSNQVDFPCQPVDQGQGPAAEMIKTSFEEDTSLRQNLEPGKIVILSADEVSSMPEPICDCFLGSGMQSLILAPMGRSESVTGVLGLSLSLPKQELSTAQKELISKITVDLGSLAQDARFLDQSRTLVASEERNRLARDLHDSVTQVLFSASLVAEVLPKIWQRDPEMALGSLDELRRLTRGALAEMRTMLLELRPAAVAKSPLPELLAQLTEASTSRVQLPFRLFIEQTPALPRDVHFAVYRIAQEALNNVAKHARASKVSLSFGTTQLTPQQTAEKMVGVRLVIEDDGVGFAPENRGVEHLGLGIMRERAADIEADLDINSRIGQGTRVTLKWCGIGEDIED